MKLIYKKTGVEVKRGDEVTLRDGVLAVVSYFAKPHKPSSEGKVSVREPGSEWDKEYYVSVIGAEWIDREDRIDLAQAVNIVYAGYKA